MKINKEEMKSALLLCMQAIHCLCEKLFDFFFLFFEGITRNKSYHNVHLSQFNFANQCYGELFHGAIFLLLMFLKGANVGKLKLILHKRFLLRSSFHTVSIV